MVRGSTPAGEHVGKRSRRVRASESAREQTRLAPAHRQLLPCAQDGDVRTAGIVFTFVIKSTFTKVPRPSLRKREGSSRERLEQGDDLLLLPGLSVHRGGSLGDLLR